MCRLLAYSGDLSSEDFQSVVSQFSSLAVNGCVPCGIPAGHLDGWGIHAATEGEEAYFRSVTPPTADLMKHSVESLNGSGLVIAHLRKATVGKNQVCNTHPFLRSGISFCHNGSIHAFPDTEFTGDRMLREGHTDSETFFLRILDRVKNQIGDASPENLKRALTQEVAEIKKTSEWTSLTCLINSKNGIILNYLWNENHPKSQELGFADYYTFFVGKKDGVTVGCSEVLDIPGFEWTKLENGALLSI